MTNTQNSDVLENLKGRLIVSCQAPDGSPLNHPKIIAAMAAVAEQHAAAGVRVNGARDIRTVRRNVTSPIIGVEKLHFPESPVYITPTWESVRRVSRSGADIVALDSTERNRPKNESLAEIVRLAKEKLGAIVLADIATLEQGIRAAELGADLVATTLFGYTEDTRNCPGPAFGLLGALVRELKLPVVMEGRVHTVDEMRRAFDLGAHAVVIGTAITNIEWQIKRFAAATPQASRRSCDSQLECV